MTELKVSSEENFSYFFTFRYFNRYQGTVSDKIWFSPENVN